VIAVISLALAEAALRLWIPLTSIVDPVSLYPKVWYLEHVDELRARGTHPTHISDPLLGWTYAPNVRDGKLSTNSQGMRGKREYDQQRPPNMKRGMVLGNSFSAGYGVNDDETYASHLERMLSDTEVLNLAVPGYGVDQAILRWEQMGRQYDPNFVILGVFVPGVHRIAGTWWFDAPKPKFQIEGGVLALSQEALPTIEDTAGNEVRLREELDSLLNSPRFWVAATYFGDRLVRRLNGWREPESSFTEKRQLLEGLISRLATDCRNRDTDLVIVTILSDYPNYPDEDRILTIVDAAAARSQTPVLHLDRYLGSDPAMTEKTEQTFDPRTAHWSPVGHRRAAHQIATFLQAAGVAED
jgi:hypothetical protein